MSDWENKVDKHLSEVGQTSGKSSWEDIVDQHLASQEPQDYSKLQSLGIAAQKGLTGGLTGVAAGVGAGLGSLSGGGDFGPAYKEGLEEQKQKEEAAHNANPITSNIAELGASIPTMAVGGGLLKGAGVASPVVQGAILGGGSGVTNYLGQNADPTVGGGLTAGGLGLGAGIGSAGKLLNPAARKLGQAGQSLFGKAAQEGLNTETEQLANSVVNTIKSEKGKLGEVYNKILEANKDKKIDLTDFVGKLKDRANNFDTSLPEQARDKKAIMDLISKVTEGPEVDKDVITGFKPGKTVEATPSAQEQLESEGNKLVESQKQLGKPASFNINPSDDQNMLTRVLRTEGENGPTASAKTVENTPGSPSYSEVSPITETQTIREGGSLTPNTEEAKLLRTNLGKIANEKSLSSSGEQFADQTYSDLSNTLKEQIPELGPTDAKYTALLKAGRKLGIKGNDEDIVRVLSKMTSSNQGKQIIVDQALNQLDSVNPNAANQIRQTAINLDQKADMIDKVSKIGNYNVLNPKALMVGLVKDLGATRVAAGNLVGQAERKLSTPAGQLIQKGLTATARSVTNKMNNPWSQNVTKQVGSYAANEAFGSTAKADDFYQPQASRTSPATQTAANLYNATDDSLKQVASTLKSTPGLQFYGDHLNKAIDTKDEGEKNRAVFLIMQNPASRKMVQGE